MAERPAGEWWQRIPPALPAVLTAMAMVAAGFWLRSPNLAYDGPPSGLAFARYQFERFSYSDIGTLFFRDGLSRHPAPYFDYDLEYPVLTGLLIYVLNVATSMPAYFLLTSLVLAGCALATSVILTRFPEQRALLFALSPALALYFNLNWDLWGILFLVIALLSFMRGRDLLGAGFLAAATWAKFFPLILLPLVLVDRVRKGQWEGAALIVVVFGLVSLIINAPVLVARPDAWSHFFRFNQTRPSEFSLWELTETVGLPAGDINRLSFILAAAGLGAMAWSVWHRPKGLLLMCCGMMAWFFLVNKVYSPQYSLWVFVLLAAAGAAPVIAAAWAGADLLYFVAVFAVFHLQQFEGAAPWFVGHVLLPAIALREIMLLVIVAWCLWQVWTTSHPAAAVRHDS